MRGIKMWVNLIVEFSPRSEAVTLFEKQKNI